MPGRFVPVMCVALAIVGSVRPFAAELQPPDRFEFSCSAFPPTTSEADLRERFGTANVTTGLVPDPNGAEGDRTEGTILFADDADARLEISWQDAAGKRLPALVSRMANRGRWRTSGGISLGTDLKTIEKLNGRPFALVGMGSDVQGTVMSWRGGRLEPKESGNCRVGVRLRVETPFLDSAAQALAREIKGDPIYSSGHPAMQTFNPTVYELFLGYGR